MKQSKSRETNAVRTGLDADSQYGAVIPPIYLSSTFSFEAVGKPRSYDYARTANPTRDALGQAIAELELGAGGIVTASGMAAVTLSCQLVDPGDTIIAPVDCYGGTYRLLTHLQERRLLRVAFVDQASETAVERCNVDRARLLWVETPTNPLLRIVDIARMRHFADRIGALLVVDNTFLSPALQRPIEFGADLVVHSTTKYLNGHSDVVGGAIVARTPELIAKLQFWANAMGLSGAPFDAYLTLRGLRTLHVRIRKHEENAAAIVAALLRHPAVGRVFYPGMENHPGHSIARRQQSGFGGMLSFELAGGERNARAFLEALKLFTLAESLGGIESLACHPATMTHVPLGPDGRRAAGIGDGLVRLSAGIEGTVDLVADVEQALGHAAAVG